MFKQTLRSAGGNVTDKHIEDVSMSTLFLLDAARKTDQAFGVAPQSTAHTVRDASSDIKKMTKHLAETRVTKNIEERLTPVFTDPTESGFKTSWLKDTLSRSHVVYNSPPSVDADTTSGDILHGREAHNDEIDMNYELL